MSLYLKNATSSVFGATRYRMQTSDVSAQASLAGAGGTYQIQITLYTCTSAGVLTQRAISTVDAFNPSGFLSQTVPVSVASDFVIPDGGGVVVKVATGGPNVGHTLSQIFYSDPQTSKMIPAGTHNFTIRRNHTSDGKYDWLTIYYGNSLSNAPDSLIATVAIPPAVPAGLTGSQNGTSVSVSWNTAADATGYKLYRGTTSDFTPGTGNLIATQAGLSFNDTITPGTTYYYKVKSYNESGESAASTQFTMASLAAPTMAGAPTVDIHGGVTLGITGASGTGIQLLRATDNDGSPETFQTMLSSMTMNWFDVDDDPQTSSETQYPYTVTNNTGGSFTVLDHRPDKNEFVEDTITYNPWGSTLHYKAKATATSPTRISPASSNYSTATISQDKEAVTDWILGQCNTFWDSLTDDKLTLAEYTSFWAYPLYDLPSRAYNWYKDKTQANLDRITAQIDYVWAQVQVEGRGSYVKNGLWWSDAGGDFPPHYSVDHVGRFLWSLWIAGQLLSAGGETTVSADIFNKLDVSAQYALSTALIPTAETRNIGGTSCSWVGLRSENRLDIQIDAPNQLSHFTAPLAFLYNDPSFTYFYQSTATYNGFTIEDIIEGSIDALYHGQLGNGASVWGFGDVTSYRDTGTHHSGYHYAGWLTAHVIQAVMPVNWSTRLNQLITDFELADTNVFSNEVNIAAYYPYEDAGTIGFRTDIDGIWSSHSAKSGSAYGNLGSYQSNSPVTNVHITSATPLKDEMRIVYEGFFGLAPVGNLVAVIDVDEVTLTWDDTSIYNDGIEIERNIDSSGWTALVTLGDVTTYIDDLTGISRDLVQYRVRQASSGTFGDWVESDVLAAYTSSKILVLRPDTSEVSIGTGLNPLRTGDTKQGLESSVLISTLKTERVGFVATNIPIALDGVNADKFMISLTSDFTGRTWGDSLLATVDNAGISLYIKSRALVDTPLGPLTASLKVPDVTTERAV